MSEPASLEDHPIPPITDPLGSGWDQPKREDIFVDQSYAMMTREACDKLAEYSCSLPSGTYSGKMWKCSHAYTNKCETYDLCWYGAISPDGKSIDIHRRMILISNP